MSDPVTEALEETAAAIQAMTRTQGSCCARIDACEARQRRLEEAVRALRDTLQSVLPAGMRALAAELEEGGP